MKESFFVLVPVRDDCECPSYWNFMEFQIFFAESVIFEEYALFSTDDLYEEPRPQHVTASSSPLHPRGGRSQASGPPLS